MSNWIDYTLDVLASSPAEINQIAQRLKQPSAKLLSWVAERDYVWNAVWAKLSPGEWALAASSREDFDRLMIPREEEAAREFATRSGESSPENREALRDLVKFEAIQNLGYVHESVNKARRFRNTSKDKCTGIIHSHLYEISEEFPSAIFLLEYCDMQASYSGKSVIRAGEVIRSTYDGNQQAQAVDWVLLDIFAPFRAEYEQVSTIANPNTNSNLEACGTSGSMTSSQPHKR